MKMLSGIEKLELVKELFEKLGIDFSGVTLGEAFTLFNSIKDEIYYFHEEKNGNKLEVK